MVSLLKQHFPTIREREEVLENIKKNPRLKEIFDGWKEEYQEAFLDICSGKLNTHSSIPLLQVILSTTIPYLQNLLRVRSRFYIYDYHHLQCLIPKTATNTRRLKWQGISHSSLRGTQPGRAPPLPSLREKYRYHLGRQDRSLPWKSHQK